MSFVIFKGDFIPSKVEVAGTEPNLHPNDSTFSSGRFFCSSHVR